MLFGKAAPAGSGCLPALQERESIALRQAAALPVQGLPQAFQRRNWNGNRAVQQPSSEVCVCDLPFYDSPQGDFWRSLRSSVSLKSLPGILLTASAGRGSKMAVCSVHRLEVNEYSTRCNTRKQAPMAKTGQTVTGAVGSSFPAIGAGFGQAVFKIAGAPRFAHSIKSPLRDPGGRSRAIDAMREYLPDDTKKPCAPFSGGASAELACAGDGIKGYGVHPFDPAVNLWQRARKPVLPTECVRRHHPLTGAELCSVQKGLEDLQDDVEKARYCGC